VAITGLLLLPPDVVLVPVAELPADVRRQLRCDEGDYALTRPCVRAPSRIVDARAAELLREFSQPSSVVEAVIRFARARGADPEATLEEAFPLLERLLAAGFLVAEGEDGADGMRPSLTRGERAGRWQVVETIQVLDDTEIHQARDGAQLAALKIERPGGRPGVAALLAHEAAVLAELDGLGGPDGSLAPRLLEQGEHEGRRFLAVEWCPGVDAESAARELRHGEESRAGLLALCRGIAEAYAGLHARGLVHGDVHPRNVLVGPAGEVRLVDFGFAGATDGAAAATRAGVGFFFEPEHAAAALGGGAVPAVPATPAGEQYAVAALLYFLVAGAHYLDFSLEREEMMRQIVEEPPRPFVDRGVEPWPQLEAVLGRTLAKAPERRFPSLAALAAALGELATAEPAATVSGRRQAARSPAAALLADVLAEVDLDGALTAGEVAPPTASIFFGAGGIACAHYRLALQRDDARHLALADFWLVRAERAAASPDAFLHPALDLTAKLVGAVSPYHTASGLAALRALVSQAQGDATGMREAAGRFVRLALAPIVGDGSPGAEGALPAEALPALPEGTESSDLTLGRSGTLLVSALLAGVLPTDASERALLAGMGRRVLAGLWAELDRLPPIAAQAVAPNLGMAHGWAGYAYATLRWCRAFGGERPAGLAARLTELAAAAEPWGRGLRWPWNGSGGAGTMPGWCNGSAGFVHLWTLAHRELGEARFLDLAAGAAWNAWEGGDTGGGLCCGGAGRAYALLNLSRHLGGDPAWLARARTLADRAALAIRSGSEKPDSLYKGRIGVALLAADLARPESAAQPFFEDEGWGTGGQ